MSAEERAHVTNRQPAVYPAATMTRLKVALCLPGGGITGAMYQICCPLRRWKTPSKESESAASSCTLAPPAEPPWRPLWPAGFRWTGSTARCSIPPTTTFHSSGSHLTKMDLDEWRRTITTAFGALNRSVRSLTSRTPSTKDLWEQLDRFYDLAPRGALQPRRVRAAPGRVLSSPRRRQQLSRAPRALSASWPTISTPGRACFSVGRGSRTCRSHGLAAPRWPYRSFIVRCAFTIATTLTGEWAESLTWTSQRWKGRTWWSSSTHGSGPARGDRRSPDRSWSASQRTRQGNDVGL